MLTHVVAFTLSDPAAAESLANQLMALVEEIPQLRSMSAGPDVLRGEGSWDLGLVATFDDRDGLEAYRVHPAHQVVADAIAAVRTDRAVVDFES